MSQNLGSERIRLSLSGTWAANVRRLIVIMVIDNFRAAMSSDRASLMEGILFPH